MAKLTVVRHGQASFLAENYDQLSELGQRQSLLLAEHWIERGERFDRVYVGPRQRQRHTYEIVAERCRRAGIAFPEAELIEDLDEYPAEPVVRTFAPVLMERHAHLRAWGEEFQTSPDLERKKKALDRVIQEVTARWLEGEVEDPALGTWDSFCARVHRAVERARRETPKGGSAALFTSGGPSAAAAQLALGLSPRKTLDLTWMTYNAAFAEYLFDEERFNLSRFNATPHLAGDGLLTYR